MSARGFGSVIWAGAVAGAALGFYLVSLNVASERAELEQVETKIALAQRDIRLLQTEIGTRGRLAQLERWNVKFIRLSAPTADQFVEGGFQLATMVTPHKKPAIEAPVVLASAPVEQAISSRPKLTGDADGPAVPATAPKSASDMMYVASYGVSSKAITRPSSVKPQPIKPTATAPANTVADKPQKPAAATKPAKTATADPLAPLPTAKPKAKGGAPTASAGAATPKRTHKDSDSD
ncbi:hypothetical protein LZ496_11275 [Sphingomonas sp. NSE70-1]|uniref:Cell division protein FtsL n=1 Tax=Sphingomonas caseinilyticus TaxID=2908205 RepID=A0ABT0RWH1_9SPHN|nr:hypothetical protein [Sphingomonas caseinilyticus]MCL6699358.1 hypothetical protein [Sphingomonas caseinilyticus]